MEPQQLIDLILQDKLGTATGPQAQALADQLQQGYLQIMTETLVNQLNEQQVDNLTQLADNPETTSDQLQAFIKQEVANQAELIAEVNQQFQLLHLGRKDEQ